MKLVVGEERCAFSRPRDDADTLVAINEIPKVLCILFVLFEEGENDRNTVPL